MATLELLFQHRGMEKPEGMAIYFDPDWAVQWAKKYQEDAVRAGNPLSHRYLVQDVNTKAVLYDALEEARAQLLKKIDRYASWLMHTWNTQPDKLPYARMRGCCEMCAQWEVGAKCASDMQRLDMIDYTVGLSMDYVGMPKEIDTDHTKEVAYHE